VWLADDSGLEYTEFSEFSLIGLIGWDSISLGVTCLVSLLLLCGLSALGYIVDVAHKRAERKVNMKKAGKPKISRANRVMRVIALTLWAIGTEASAGALSG
jgi:hypothetical protein